MKSSLAFDTLHAEGQRRDIETFKAYARQFIGCMDQPDVDKVDGLAVVAIEQKTTRKSPRSTVERLLSCMIFDCSMPELPMPTAVPHEIDGSIR